METVAVVVATIVGPVAAVIITRIMDDRKARIQRQFWILSTLMQLRGQSIHAEHVRALNVVQLEFAKSQKVIESWKKFIAHVEGDPNNDAVEWNRKYQDLLTQLLVDMVKELGVPADDIDLRRGGYYPKGWAFEQERLESAQKFIQSLAKDEAAIPVVIKNQTE